MKTNVISEKLADLHYIHVLFYFNFRNWGNQYEALVRPHSETMDLTQEVPDIICVDDHDSGK